MYWITNPDVSSLKPQVDSNIDAAFHLSEVGQISTSNSWGLSGKVKSLFIESLQLFKTVEPYPLNLCVFVLDTLLFLSRGIRMWALSSECKTVQADFTDWMSFLSSSLVEEIISNSEALNTNTKAFVQHLIAIKTRFRNKCVNIANWLTYLYWK